MIMDSILAVLLTFMICLQTLAVSRISVKGYELAGRKGEEISRKAEAELRKIPACIICIKGEDEEAESFPED